MRGDVVDDPTKGKRCPSLVASQLYSHQTKKSFTLVQLFLYLISICVRF
jgi:hypothetical protein